MQEVRKHKVYDKVPIQECWDVIGKKPVGTRWVVINKGDKALALYLFSRSKSNINKFLNITSSGTVAINECMLQYANPNLPFGGVNTSGIGKTGGKSGVFTRQ